MSIAFGIYDFFSYTVPGVFYILVANQLLLLLKLPSILSQQPERQFWKRFIMGCCCLCGTSS